MNRLLFADSLEPIFKEPEDPKFDNSRKKLKKVSESLQKEQIINETHK